MIREKAILVVDDNPANLSFIHDLLRPHYKIYLANSGPRALELLERGIPIDLVLLDVMMPGMDGYQVCSHIKRVPAFAELPVIFVTAQTREEEEAQALSLGAADFISKPLSPPLLMARVRNHLHFAEASQLLRQQNSALESRVAERTRELQQRATELSAVKEATIMAFCSLAEARDNETGNHIRRTQEYIRRLAEHLSTHASYAEQLDRDTIDVLAKSAPLHDIGKVGIPDHILLKPGPLTQAEFEVMKTHTTLGRDAIRRAEESMVAGSSFLRYAREIAYSHHERWDGKGYPLGLAGEQIPFAARLMAVADVYDALISRRPYKQPIAHDKAREMILALSGQAFDPVVAEAFRALEGDFAAIADGFRDNYSAPKVVKYETIE